MCTIYLFIQLSAKKIFNLHLNKERLKKLLGDRFMDEIRKETMEKVSQIDEDFEIKDLHLLVRDAVFWMDLRLVLSLLLREVLILCCNCSICRCIDKPTIL